MQKIKLYFSSITYHVLLASMILLFSCKKDRNIDDNVIRPNTSDFTLRDTLKIEPQYQTGPFADVYNRYNGKTYSVNSINTVEFKVQKLGNNIEFSFFDASVANLYPNFFVVIQNTEFKTLATEYNLTDSKIVNIRDNQTFVDGSSAVSLQTKVISGILKIKYNANSETLTGEIVNLKIPLGYFTPENIPSLTRSSNGILLEHGGSTRTVSLKFANVKIK